MQSSKTPAASRQRAAELRQLGCFIRASHLSLGQAMWAACPNLTCPTQGTAGLKHGVSVSIPPCCLRPRPASPPRTRPALAAAGQGGWAEAAGRPRNAPDRGPGHPVVRDLPGSAAEPSPAAPPPPPAPHPPPRRTSDGDRPGRGPPFPPQAGLVGEGGARREGWPLPRDSKK